jgi:catechol 2,3-dioxygenase-like lactoylglutathione lyase family enzyme
MKLGAFSMSLSVKDLSASRTFYEKLGFEVFAGSSEQHYLIMKNGDSLVGLFEGMFEGNILTFNPGWDQQAQKLTEFDDVREINRRLRDAGVPTMQESLKETSGPGSFVVQDPDGNYILIDQHV